MKGTPRESRYRVEGTHTCIDISLHTAQQLFDGRDPAPFRERDLDEDAADYIYAAATDIPRERPLKLVLVMEQPLGPSLSASVIETAVRAHFQYEADRVNRQLRQQRRFGRAALAAGLTALVVLLTLGEIGRRYLTGHAGEIVQTGLVIMGWVAMWKPIEVLLYEWWPLVQQRTEISRIVAAQIEVRTAAAVRAAGSSTADIDCSPAAADVPLR